MPEGLDRKIKEKFGSAHTYTVLSEFAFPDLLEGGDGVCYVIQLDNGKVSAWLSTGGLYYETDVPEIEGYFAKVAGEWPVEAITAIGLINGQKHGLPVAPLGSTETAATVAEISATKHKRYLADPTPPDITPDVLRDGERNADMS